KLQDQETAKDNVVVELFHQESLAAHRVENLKQQRPKQLLRGNRGTSQGRVNLLKPRRQLLQHLLGHRTNRPQRMILRNSSLRRNVTEHAALLGVVSAHRCPSFRKDIPMPADDPTPAAL